MFYFLQYPTRFLFSSAILHSNASFLPLICDDIPFACSKRRTKLGLPYFPFHFSTFFPLQSTCKWASDLWGSYEMIRDNLETSVLILLSPRKKKFIIIFFFSCFLDNISLHQVWMVPGYKSIISLFGFFPLVKGVFVFFCEILWGRKEALCDNARFVSRFHHSWCSLSLLLDLGNHFISFLVFGFSKSNIFSPHFLRRRDLKQVFRNYFLFSNVVCFFENIDKK